MNTHSDYACESCELKFRIQLLLPPGSTVEIEEAYNCPFCGDFITKLKPEELP